MSRIRITTPQSVNVNSFSIIQPDLGTSPVANSPNDTLILTSSDNSVTITGDSTTDTIDITTGGGVSTQYDEGDGPITTATGNFLVFKNSSDIMVGVTDLTGLPIDIISSIDIDVIQSTHDNLNANANIQVNNIDVSNANPVPISDAGGSITIDGTVSATQSGTWNINNISGTISLPTGAATESTLSSIDTEVTSIDAKTPSLGQTLMALSTPVVIASDQSAVPISDDGGSITVDGTVAATQSGTWNINNISGTISLPTGAATLTEQQSQTTLLGTIDADTSTIAGAVSGTEMQVDIVAPLPAGSNTIGAVTQASAPWDIQGELTAGSAVTGTNPILVGGEDPSGNLTRLQTAPDGDLITHVHTDSFSFIDGVSNTERIPVNESDFGFYTTPIFPFYYNGSTWDRIRGSATDGLLVNLGANNDVSVTGTVTANQGGSPWQIEGELATGSPVSGTNPVVMAGRSVGGNVSIPTMITAGALDVFGVVVASTTGTAMNINDSGAFVVGSRAHDGVDGGNPVKIGGRVETNTSGFTAVADGDRTDAWFSDVGRQHVQSAPHFAAIVSTSSLDDTFDNVTTTSNTGDITVGNYNRMLFGLNISSNNTPTRIIFTLQYKSGANYFNYMQNVWARFVFDDTAVSTAIRRTINFDVVPGSTIRIVATATGTSAVNTFTVSESFYQLYTNG